MLKTPMAAKVYVISLVFFLVLMMSTTVIKACLPAGAMCELGLDQTCCGYPNATCFNYQIVSGHPGHCISF